MATEIQIQTIRPNDDFKCQANFKIGFSLHLKFMLLIINKLRSSSKTQLRLKA